MEINNKPVGFLLSTAICWIGPFVRSVGLMNLKQTRGYRLRGTVWAVWKDVVIISSPALWIYPSVSPPIVSFPRHASLLPFSLFLFLPDFVHNLPIHPALRFPKPPIPLVSSQIAFRQAVVKIKPGHQETGKC